jgi:N-acetylglucosaminyldiphosphoundecaprenol N-acetyl-beta-D-mannosaminyltransferase
VERAVTVAGIAFAPLTHAEAIAQIDRFVQEGRPRQVVTANLDFARLARRDPDFRAAIAAADLVVADGMPIVWLSRLRGTPLPERVSGIDLMDGCAELAARRGYGIFLLGAGPGIAARAATALQRRYPGLRIAGTLTPPMGVFSPETDAALVKAVRAAAPEMLFVALGAPRQELWLRAHLAELGVPVCVGVGCAFDVLSGRRSRAPRWMRRSGLEWTFRLAQEPRRLWRRYLLGDLPLFARMLGEQLFTTHDMPESGAG